MNSLLVFVVLSLIAIVFSHKSLRAFRSHGFYRFWSWECIIGIFAFNYKFWFVEPFSIRQICSWLLLIISIYLVLAGINRLKKAEKATSTRKDKALYNFEKTSELIVNGIFSYIRHPMYSSLMMLALGVMLKNITVWTLAMACAATFFLYLTALADERECMAYFGDSYKKYMSRTKRFIPFIF